MEMIIGNMKVHGWVWFCGRESIGIVHVVDSINGKEKAYITTVIGSDIPADVKHIVEYGSFFPVEEAKSLIDKLGHKYDKL